MEGGRADEPLHGLRSLRTEGTLELSAFHNRKRRQSDDRKIRPPTDAYGAIGTNHDLVGRSGGNAYHIAPYGGTFGGALLKRKWRQPGAAVAGTSYNYGEGWNNYGHDEDLPQPAQSGNGADSALDRHAEVVAAYRNRW
jgi:hypothetical protein